MFWKIVRLTAVPFLIFALLLNSITGCGGPPSLGSPGGQASAVVSVWHSLQGQQAQQLSQEIARISQKRPEILIKTEYIPEASFSEQVWKYQAGGEGPEIFISSTPVIMALYEKGCLSPAVATQNVFPAAQALYSFNQKIFGVPWLIDVPLLYYRSDKAASPVSLNEIWEKKSAVGIPSTDLSLLSPWWQAEGGYLSQAGDPALNASYNLAFMQKLQYLKSEGLLLTDPNALNLFINGEIDYLITWASHGRVMNKNNIAWGCISLTELLGPKGKVFLDNQIAIANSSIKTTPALTEAVKIIEDELLSLESVTAMAKAGGGLPAVSSYYEGAAPLSLNAEVNKTLVNALILEGNLRELKLFSLMKDFLANNVTGATLEQEINKIQARAQEEHKDQ